MIAILHDVFTLWGVIFVMSAFVIEGMIGWR